MRRPARDRVVELKGAKLTGPVLVTGPIPMPEAKLLNPMEERSTPTWDGYKEIIKKSFTKRGKEPYVGSNGF
jgi:hypothetical protein